MYKPWHIFNFCTRPGHNFSHRKEHYPIVDILSMGDPAESESVKAFKYKWLLAVYNSLFPGWALKYLTIQSTTSLCWLTTLKENIGIWLSNGRIILPTKQRYHLRLENNFGFVSCSPLYTLCSGVCPLFVFSMNYTHTLNFLTN